MNQNRMIECYTCGTGWPEQYFGNKVKEENQQNANTSTIIRSVCELDGSVIIIRWIQNKLVSIVWMVYVWVFFSLFISIFHIFAPPSSLSTIVDLSWTILINITRWRPQNTHYTYPVLHRTLITYLAMHMGSELRNPGLYIEYIKSMS